MSRFYVKDMAVDEWTTFQDRFTEVWEAMGAPEETALFHRRADGRGQHTIAAANFRRETLEALSPTGWCGVEALNLPPWGVLIANGEPAKLLGVPISDGRS